MLGPDIPFENGSMRKLIEADVAVQKVAHVHLALQRALQGIAGPSAGNSGHAAATTDALLPDVSNDDADPGGLHSGIGADFDLNDSAMDLVA